LIPSATARAHSVGEMKGTVVGGPNRVSPVLSIVQNTQATQTCKRDKTVHSDLAALKKKLEGYGDRGAGDVLVSGGSRCSSGTGNNNEGKLTSIRSKGQNSKQKERRKRGSAMVQKKNETPFIQR